MARGSEESGEVLETGILCSANSDGYCMGVLGRNVVDKAASMTDQIEPTDDLGAKQEAMRQRIIKRRLPPIPERDPIAVLQDCLDYLVTKRLELDESITGLQKVIATMKAEKAETSQ